KLILYKVNRIFGVPGVFHDLPECFIMCETKQPRRTMIILENITMTDFSKHLRRTKTIVFPFGTIEEHGSHLPLNTDSLIIHEALRRLKRKKEFFLAPVVDYGVCTTNKDHPGTLSITPETL